MVDIEDKTDNEERHRDANESLKKMLELIRPYVPKPGVIPKEKREEYQIEYPTYPPRRGRPQEI